MRIYIKGYHKIIELISYVLVLASLVLAIVGMAVIKNDVPIHYNLAGEADGYGSFGALIIFPIVMLFTNAIVSLLMRFAGTNMVNLPFRIREDAMPLAMNLTVLMLVLTMLDFSVMSLAMVIMSFFALNAGPVIFLIVIILSIQTVAIISYMGKKCKA